MVEEQVDVELILADLQVDLSADKGKAPAELKEELFEVLHQGGFEFPLLEWIRQGEKIKNIGIFQGLHGEFGLGHWKVFGEVIHLRALSQVSLVFQHDCQCIPTPALFHCFF